MGLLSFSLPCQKFPYRLRVLRSITKTLEAAYLLKTGGRERVKKVSVSSISLLVHGVGLLEPPELRFLPLGPPNHHFGWSNPLKAQHYLRGFDQSDLQIFLQRNPPGNNQ